MIGVWVMFIVMFVWIVIVVLFSVVLMWLMIWLVIVVIFWVMLLSVLLMIGLFSSLVLVGSELMLTFSSLVRLSVMILVFRLNVILVFLYCVCSRLVMRVCRFLVLTVVVV